MRKIVILSGPSGSGKSTWVKDAYPEAMICSADQYFVDEDTGEYQFDPTKLPIAHSECMSKFITNLQKELSKQTGVLRRSR